MARICVLSTVHPISDVRVFYKECKTLKSAGHEVFLIITHDKDECIDGIKIIHLKQPKNRFHRMFFNTLQALIKAVKIRASFYHFHDPELIPVGIILKLLGKKVIYDVHENVPDQVLNKEWLGNIYIKKIVSMLINIFERLASMFFDLVIAATPGIKERFNSSRSVLVRNYPILKMFDDAEKINVIKNSKPVIIYIGALTKSRGISEVIQAMDLLDDKVEFWLAGQWINEGFERECRNLKGWKNAQYIGLLKADDVYGYVKSADIGIVTCYPVESYINSLPTKAFEYMSCSLPMIMSNFPLWQDLFTDCALFADPLEPDDIAGKIRLLLNDEKLMTRLGRKGRDLIDKKYSWESESKKLINAYHKLISKK